MSQYQGMIYDMWHYSLKVYVPEREWNRLTMRLYGVQHIIQGNIFAEMHLFIVIYVLKLISFYENYFVNLRLIEISSHVSG